MFLGDCSIISGTHAPEIQESFEPGITFLMTVMRDIVATLIKTKNKSTQKLMISALSDLT